MVIPPPFDDKRIRIFVILSLKGSIQNFRNVLSIYKAYDELLKRCTLQALPMAATFLSQSVNWNGMRSSGLEEHKVKRRDHELEYCTQTSETFSSMLR